MEHCFQCDEIGYVRMQKKVLDFELNIENNEIAQVVQMKIVLWTCTYKPALSQSRILKLIIRLNFKSSG